MSNITTLTGRTRYRIEERFFSPPLVVLQVEQQHKGTIIDGHGYGPDYDYCSWRDASVSDLTVMEKIE